MASGFMARSPVSLVNRFFIPLLSRKAAVVAIFAWYPLPFVSAPWGEPGLASTFVAPAALFPAMPLGHQLR